jgi:hypothetical protein
MIEKKWQEIIQAVQRKLHVCCSYMETVINPLLRNGWRREPGKGLAVAAVICEVREPAKRLQLIVVMVCKSPVVLGLDWQLDLLGSYKP